MTAVKFIVLAVLLAVTAATVAIAVSSQLLPMKYILIIGVALLALLVIVALLVWDTRKKGCFWTGTVIALVIAALLVVGCMAGLRGVNTVRAITASPTYTAANIGVYVRADDPVQAMDELVGKSFGIMGQMGREDVDKAIVDLNEALGTTIQTKEYDSPNALVDALLDGGVDAAIMDASYIAGLSELEAYQTVSTQIRQVTDVHVELPVAPTETPAVEPTPEPETGVVFTALISGIDSRGGLVRSSLSDVNILVTVNTATRQVLMVSTPRDYFVTFPNTGMKDKLTHAGYYGIDTCMSTLESLYGIDIDYYFRVNFGGFIDIINALGGVTVHSDYAFSREGFDFVQGENTLNGEQALAFTRERKAFIDGDRQRGKNQMAVIRAVLDKVMSPSMLQNYTTMLDTVEGSFETSVPYDLISKLVRQQLDQGGEWNIVSYSVTGSDQWAKSPLLGDTEVSVMEPDMTTVETAKGLMRQVRDGNIVAAP